MAQHAVLFDLDGTLFDTAPDFAVAINKLIQTKKLDATPVTPADIRPHISEGAQFTLSQVFKLPFADAKLKVLLEEFLNYYRATEFTHSTPFVGIDNLLCSLEQNKILWGIVTNKPQWLTDPFLQKHNYYERAACIVAGDTTPHRKPHPAPVLHACEQLKCQPEACVFVGDAERDILAGNAAGTKTITALFGYVPNIELAQAWPATYHSKSPKDLYNWLMKYWHLAF